MNTVERFISIHVCIYACLYVYIHVWMHAYMYVYQSMHNFSTMSVAAPSKLHSSPPQTTTHAWRFTHEPQTKQRSLAHLTFPGLLQHELVVETHPVAPDSVGLVACTGRTVCKRDVGNIFPFFSPTSCTLIKVNALFIILFYHFFEGGRHAGQWIYSGFEWSFLHYQIQLMRIQRII